MRLKGKKDIGIPFQPLEHPCSYGIPRYPLLNSGWHIVFSSNTSAYGGRMLSYVTVAIAGIGLVCAIVLFNRIVALRNIVSEAWSNIDVQLKRRHNLVPSLVECVSGYARHEMAALTSVTKLRAGSGNDVASTERMSGENELTGQLKSLLAVVEQYPDLKANRSFLELQNQLTEIEDQIQYARRYYNGAVRDYNVRVESFPGLLVAWLFGFKQAAFFEIQVASERIAPPAELAPDQKSQ